MGLQKSGSVRNSSLLSGIGLATALTLSSCHDDRGADSSRASETSGLAGMNLQASQPGLREQLIAQAVQFKGLITGRFAELQGQRDRQGKLTAELMNKTSSGCFADSKLAKLEILIKGSWLPRKNSGTSKNPMSSNGSGNPTTVTFQFGDALAVFNDEQTSGMFQPAGRKVVTELADFKLSDIEYLRIAKGGAGYDSERVCKASGFLGTSESCEYQNYEENRMELDSIELKANGETFYKRDAIQKQFEANSLEWRDDQVHINESWLKLMVRTDCIQGQ